MWRNINIHETFAAFTDLGTYFPQAIIYNVLYTVRENIITTIKMRNNFFTL